MPFTCGASPRKGSSRFGVLGELRSSTCDDRRPEALLRRSSPRSLTCASGRRRR
jgi:hypothetical protein